MADGKYERLVELRSRLPNVSDTVISYFLSKYENVEECYEKLKSGCEEPGDNFDPRLLSPAHYNNAPIQSSGQDTRLSPTHTQNWRHNYPPSDSPTRSGAAVGGGGSGSKLSNLPTSAAPVPYQEKDPMNNGSNLDYELICDQKDQLEFLEKERVRYNYAAEELRQEVDFKRHRLTDLRIRVSDCPTKMDVTSTQDIISTLEHDVHALRNKVEVAQQQSVMKKNLDMYTEEGVRWDCKYCKFLNHPLMSRCENCDKTR